MKLCHLLLMTWTISIFLQEDSLLGLQKPDLFNSKMQACKLGTGHIGTPRTPPIQSITNIAFTATFTLDHIAISCKCSLWIPNIPNAQESNAIERKRGTGIADFQNSTRSAYQITVHNVSSNCKGTPKPGKNMLCLQLNVFDDCSWLDLWKWKIMKNLCTTQIR